MTSLKGRKNGIHMRRYCLAHEVSILSRLEAGRVDGELLSQHELKIRWLQHERLIHLIVTFLISVLFLFSIVLFIVLGDPFVLVLIAIVLVLLAAYIRHYFFLENRVQYWYTLYDEMYCRLNGK